MKKFNTIESFLSEFPKASFARIVLLTNPRMKKRNNPYLDRVQKITIFRGAKLGVDYAHAMENAYARTHGERSEETYKVDTNTGKGTWVEGFKHYLTENEKGSKYLHVFSYDSCTKKFVCYLLDGKPIRDKALLEEVKSYFYASSSKPCPKQAAFGIGEEELPHLVTPLYESVYSLKCKRGIYTKVLI